MSRPEPIGSGTSRQTVVPSSSNSRSRKQRSAAVREKHVNGFQMRPRHGENVGGAIDQRGGERLAAKSGDVDAFGAQRLNRDTRSAVGRASHGRPPKRPQCHADSRAAGGKVPPPSGSGRCFRYRRKERVSRWAAPRALARRGNVKLNRIKSTRGAVGPASAATNQQERARTKPVGRLIQRPHFRRRRGPHPSAISTSR